MQCSVAGMGPGAGGKVSLGKMTPKEKSVLGATTIDDSFDIKIVAFGGPDEISILKRNRIGWLYGLLPLAKAVPEIASPPE